MCWRRPCSLGGWCWNRLWRVFGRSLVHQLNFTVLTHVSGMCLISFFQGLPQSGVMLEGYTRQPIATFHYLMEWMWELLKKTSNRHATVRTMNPGQQFDAGIKYVWSSRNSNKNVSLLRRFFSQLDAWFWTPRAPSAWSLHSQAVFSSSSSLLGSHRLPVVPG